MPVVPHSAPSLAYQKFWLAIGLSMVLLLLYGSLAQARALPPVGGSDKFWHAGCYFVVMAYFSQIFARVRPRALIGAALIALGVAIECIQPYVNREFDLLDALANAIGVFAAIAVSVPPFSLIIAWVDRQLQRGLV